MEALPAGRLQDVYQEALGAAVIGIDEGQFVSAWLGRFAGLCGTQPALYTLCRPKSVSFVGEGGQ